MAELDADVIVERRRLRRRLSFWRVFAIVFAVLALGVLALQSTGLRSAIGGAHVARVTITGLITEDRKQLKLLRDLAKSRNVKAVILSIDSPGGTTTGGEALYNEILKLAKKKPVVAVFGTMATSAAYMIALASDQIIARENTITGSVGVILQWPEVHEALAKLGIKINEITSGPLKAKPSMFAKADERGRAVVEELVKEANLWFRGLVERRRSVSVGAVPGLGEGRVYSGRQALRYKLIDQIGGEDEARAWLNAKHKISLKLEIVDRKPKSDRFSLLNSLTRSFGKAVSPVGLSAADAPVIKDIIGRLELDGLLSIWQPS